MPTPQKKPRGIRHYNFILFNSCQSQWGAHKQIFILMIIFIIYHRRRDVIQVLTWGGKDWKHKEANTQSIYCYFYSSQHVLHDPSWYIPFWLDSSTRMVINISDRMFLSQTLHGHVYNPLLSPPMADIQWFKHLLGPHICNDLNHGSMDWLQDARTTVPKSSGLICTSYIVTT